MFTLKDIQNLDNTYFNIIKISEYDVEIQSSNIGHVWLLHSPINDEEGSCIIFHKHHIKHQYHRHGTAGNMAKAVRSIKLHDKWQLEGRMKRA